MDGSDDGLRRSFERCDHLADRGRVGNVRVAELGDVHTGEEGPSLAVDHQGLRFIVAFGHTQTVDQSLAHMVAHGIDGGIVGNEDGDPVPDVISNGLAQLFHLNPWETSREETTAR